MIKSFYLILLFVISYETLPDSTTSPPSNSYHLFLPMKKDNKFGDDICYYRDHDDKLNYYIYYVKPCEKGKYCQSEISDDQPFGYCVDIQTNSTTISSWNEQCDSDVDCQDGLTCENGKCVKYCPNQNDVQYQHDKISFECHTNYKQVDAKYCKLNELHYDTNNYYTHISNNYKGNYPGLPNECGKINYKLVNYQHNTGTELVDDIKYIEESQEWCTIGSVPDNEFVSDEKYCYSGFTLYFYPNKLYKEPSKYFTHSAKKMCVTPIEIDTNNPFVSNGCVITYKIGEQSPKKYNSNQASGLVSCSKETIIRSERHREFVDAFNEANDEDKKNCFDIDAYPDRCKNVKLLKLWYFRSHPEEYLFYKDRKKLEKVLDYKIQREYPTYSEFAQYLNYNYLLFLLFLIIMN